MSRANSPSWGARVFGWFERHGRHDLPWQSPRDPYRVWVSEIMLQQTGVATVIPYFRRFIAAFPDVQTLADAEQDAVLALWSGLGYYARGRNLHRAARVIRDEHGGHFPRAAAALEALPGVGRSTAAAIRAQAFDEPAAVLDGNVKRLLARHGGIEGWPGESRVQQRLWLLAEQRLPAERAADYAQATMDLGALICRRRKPVCGQCPVAEDCAARRQGRIDAIPAARPRREHPRRHAQMLIAINRSGEVLLQRRPENGVWGGLWSLPEQAADQPADALAGELGLALENPREVAGLTHEFSHFSLRISPVVARARVSAVADDAQLCWYAPEALDTLGLPRPVARLLAEHLPHRLRTPRSPGAARETP